MITRPDRNQYYHLGMSASVEGLNDSDIVLSRYLSSSAAESTAELRLLSDNTIRPVIESYVRRKLGSEATAYDLTQDICGEALSSTIERIVGIRGGSAAPIRNLPDYARQVAQSKFDNHLRRLRPHYWSVMGSIRYVCGRNMGIGAWEANGVEVVGRSSGIGQAPREPRLRALREALERGTAIDELIGPFRKDNRPDILMRLVVWAESPIPFDLAVRSICAAQQLRDIPPQPLEEADHVDPALTPFARASAREELRAIWFEIRELPAKQRAALLLNLRDQNGDNLVALLLLGELVDFAGLAAALEMEETELLSIWNDLPLSDAAIAERLAATPLQVSNLRAAARARLTRKMAKEGYV